MPPHAEDLSELVRVVHGLLSPEECADWIAWAEAQGFDEAPVTTGVGMVMMKELRNNTRVMVDDPARAALLWERVRPFAWPRWQDRPAVGLNERLRIYRYRPGERFNPHYDGAYARPNGERSEFTCMIYLNAVERGGETNFYRVWSAVEAPWARVVPAPGLGLLFKHRLRHEGAEVLAGVKYAVRSDVLYAPPR